MASHLLNTLGAIGLWLSIGCCLLIAAYLLCWFLGREAQRPGMASLEAFGDFPHLPEGAKAATRAKPEGEDRAKARAAERTSHGRTHDRCATI